MIFWSDSYGQFVEYLKENGYKSPFVVCDKNTYDICAKKVVDHLKRSGYDFKLFCFSDRVVADEYAIGKVVFEYSENDIMVAVGSGTITDIARFCSSRFKIPFVVFPTAPSMDGFTSSVCAMTIDNIKTSVVAKPPCAMFVDIDVIDSSPEILKKAGFGDLCGKITALLDWRLSNILLNEKIDEDVIKSVKDTYKKALYSIYSQDFSRNLLEGLILSGNMMAKVGSSRPASGSEHHVAHLLEYHKVNTYHGIKVGIATLYIMEFYRDFLKLSKDDIKECFNYKIDKDKWQNQVKSYFKYNYEQILAKNNDKIETINDPAFREDFIERLIQKKDIIDLMIVEDLKIYDDLISSYEKLNMPMSYKDINIDENLFKMAFVFAPDIRERFTILHLYQILRLTEKVTVMFK